jgi:hypothetical protein
VLAKSSADLIVLNFYLVGASEMEGFLFWEKESNNLWVDEVIHDYVLKRDLRQGIEPETDECQFSDRFWKQW